MEPRARMLAIGPDTSPAEVAAFLDHPETDEAHVLALLRKRTLSGFTLEALARHERWGSRHSVRAAIVNHPKTPRTVALRLLVFLYWHELLRVTQNARLTTALRVAAERTLRERLPELELGEKITLARAAPPGLVKALLEEQHPRIVGAILSNPRLLEADVLVLVENGETAPETLRLIGESYRWCSRHSIQLGLIKNRRTPAHVALRLLTSIPHPVLKDLLAKDALPPVVRVGAERILDGEKIGRPFRPI